MGIEKIDALPETVLWYDGVRIQEQDEFSFRKMNSLVAGFGKTGVLRIAHEIDTGKLRLKIGDAVVGGVIVDHYYFRIKSCNRFLNGVEALFQEMSDIIIDYDDR